MPCLRGRHLLVDVWIEAGSCFGLETTVLHKKQWRTVRAPHTR